jgi:outer membrane lipoprotein SlyB
MQKFTRLSGYVAGGVMVAMLAACADYPTTSAYPSYPSTSSYPVSSAPVAGIEYGRIVNIEYLPVGSTATTNNGVLGAVVGGVAGALLGSTIGGGSGRTAATVLGGVAGAAVGNHLGRNSAGATTPATASRCSPTRATPAPSKCPPRATCAWATACASRTA